MRLLSTLSTIVAVCEKSLPLTNTTIHYTQLILVVPLWIWSIPSGTAVAINAPRRTFCAQNVLLGAFTTAVPLGMDQIHSCAVSNISAFMQWLIWVYFSGIALPGIMRSVI